MPILKSSTNKNPTSVKKKVGLFEIGSGESSEGSVSMSQRSLPHEQTQHSSLRRPRLSKKQTSFKDEVIEIKPAKNKPFSLKEEEDDGAAIESDTEDEDEDAIDDDDDEASDNAVDDDDEEAWEDDTEADDEPKELPFERVPSKPKLVSRRSILADQLHEADRSAALMRSAASAPRLHRSRTSTPNGPSMAGSPSADSPLATEGAFAGFQPHRSMPPMKTAKETRQQMLMQELGPELRQNMLNERAPRNFMPKRGQALPGRAYQSSVDMTRLKSGQQSSDQNQLPNQQQSFNYYDDHSTDYHATGW